MRAVVPWVVALLVACAGGDDDTAATGPNSGPGASVIIDIPLPEELRPYLLDVRDRLIAPICERASHCCPFFGLTPRRDCGALADEVIVFGFAGLVLEDISTYRFEPVPEFAEECVRRATEGQDVCVQGLIVDWARPCLQMVRYWDEADPFASGSQECDPDHDEDCLVLKGPGHVCADGMCMPAIEVGVGESCFRGQGATSAPVCAAGGYCEGGVTSMGVQCAPQAALGEPCERWPGACEGDLHCAGTFGCQERGVEGDPCGDGRECAEGYGCRGPNDAQFCVRRHLFGEACTDTAQCIGGQCLDGICHPGMLGYCTGSAAPGP